MSGPPVSRATGARASGPLMVFRTAASPRAVRKSMMMSGPEARAPEAKKKPGICPAFPQSSFYGSALVEEAAQHARAARVLELAQRLGLDLANALAGHRE